MNSRTMNSLRQRFIQRSIQTTLALALGLAGLNLAGFASAQAATPPWGSASVHQVLQIHGCTVYGLDSDPEHTFWVVCAPTGNGAQSQGSTSQGSAAPGGVPQSSSHP